MFVNTVKYRLKQLRHERGLTIAEFSAMIDVSPGNVGDWESERRSSVPGAKALVAIAEKFNVSLDWILLGKTPQKSSNASSNKNRHHAASCSDGCLLAAWEKNSQYLNEEPETNKLFRLLEDAASLSVADLDLLIRIAERLNVDNLSSLSINDYGSMERVNNIPKPDS